MTHVATRILILSLCSFVPTFNLQQPPAKQTAQQTADKTIGTATPEALLIRSYLLGQQFTPEERAFHLTELTRAAAKIEPPFDRLWAEQLFQLSFQLPMSWNRVAHEKNALQALAEVDPIRAFELFGTLDDPVPTPAGTLPEDVRAYAARTVFYKYWKLRGTKSLGDIRAQAEHLGETGQYPYAAIALIIRDVEREDKLEAQSLYDDALTFYGQGSRFSQTDEEFLGFVNTLWDVTPLTLKTQALQLSVARLIEKRKPDTDTSYVGTVTSDQGTVQFEEKERQLLYELLPRIREVDPQWADRVARDDLAVPSRADAANNARSEGAVIEGVSGADPSQLKALRERILQGQRADQISEVAKTDPARAYTLSRTLTDSEFRADVLAAVAEGYSAENDPHSEPYLDEASKIIESMHDSPGKVHALTSLARAAATIHDLKRLRTTLKQGLDLGEELFSEDRDVHPGKLSYDAVCFAEMMRLTRIGAQSDAQWTLTYLDRVQDELLQAYLPIEAALALFDDQRTNSGTATHSIQTN